MTAIPSYSPLQLTHPQHESKFLSRWARHFSIRFTLGIFVLSLIAAIGARVLHFNVGPYPFTPYETILPGAADDRLTAFNCRSLPLPPAGSPVASSEVQCSIIPSNPSLFHLITIKVHNEQITELTFYSGFLRIEQLMEYWGSPQSVSRSNHHDSFTFSWSREGYMATAILARPFESRMVRLVILTSK